MSIQPNSCVAGNRRAFLANAGAASAIGATMTRQADADASPRPGPPRGQGRFTRLFPMLPPFAEPGRRINRAMLELGRPGGLLDANDDLAAGPVLLIPIPTSACTIPTTRRIRPGSSFVGQFMDQLLIGKPPPAARASRIQHLPATTRDLRGRDAL